MLGSHSLSCLLLLYKNKPVLAVLTVLPDVAAELCFLMHFQCCWISCVLDA